MTTTSQTAVPVRPRPQPRGKGRARPGMRPVRYALLLLFLLVVLMPAYVLFVTSF